VVTIGSKHGDAAAAAMVVRTYCFSAAKAAIGSNRGHICSGGAA
jgi:hypothetical protein